MVSHVLTPEIVGMFERVLREAPGDHRVVFLLSAEAAPPPRRLPPSLEGRLVQLRRAELLRPGYVEKCREPGWDIAGNLDLAFLEFCTARSKAAVDHAAIRRWITLGTGTASRLKAAVDHASNRHPALG